MTDRSCLVVHPAGRRFRLGDGDPVCLERRRKLQPLLSALVAQRLASPGEPIASAVLIARGWPGERIARSAARARLHVAISSLRRMGLGGSLRHAGGGYLLDPRLPVEIAE